MFRKINISNSLIRTPKSAYQEAKNVNFSQNFTYVLNESLKPFYSSVTFHRNQLLDLHCQQNDWFPYAMQY